MFDIEVQEEKKKKQAAVQQLFQERLRQRKKSTNVPIKPDISWQLKYEQEKKKRKTAEKTARQQEKKIAEQQMQLRKHEQRLQEETNKQAVAYQTVKQAQMNEQTHQAHILRLEQEIASLHDKWHNQQEQKTQATDNAYKKKWEETNRQLKKQNLLRTRLQEENQSLKNKLKINYSLRRMEKNVQQEQEIRHLRQRNRDLLVRLESYQQSQEPVHLLKVVQDLITEQNIAHFFDGPHNKLELLAKKANEMKWHKQNKKGQKKPSAHLTTSYAAHFRFGYIAKRIETWYFFDAKTLGDADAEVYPVIGNTTRKTFEQDVPVKVYLREDGYVMVVERYEEYTLPVSAEPKCKEKAKGKEKKVYPSFGNHSILLIGSRQLATYKQRLEKHGLTVDIHNPFEESYHRIKGKVMAADIVIVCTSHISHSVMDHVNKKDQKIELIERDNEEWIAARVRFALMERGLFHPVEQDVH